jgi:hypothetical protein
MKPSTKIVVGAVAVLLACFLLLPGVLRKSPRVATSTAVPALVATTGVPVQYVTLAPQIMGYVDPNDEEYGMI